MRRALLSDIHGDHLAFVRVIPDLERAGEIDEVVLGGDLAQGGAQPVQVIDEIQRRGWRSVRGNSDDLLVRVGDGMTAADALSYGESTHGPAPEAVARYTEWTVDQLGKDRIALLRSLPTAIEWGPFGVGRIALVHATPWSTEDVILPDAEKSWHSAP